MRAAGVIRLDKKTKNLAKRLRKGEIALIDHQDIDSTSARMLIEARVSAVVNASMSISGRYPNSGPTMLLAAGIPILDNVGPGIFDIIKEGETVKIEGNHLQRDGNLLAEGVELTTDDVEEMLEESKKNLDSELERFAENTLTYVMKEKSLLLDTTRIPEIDTLMRDRHVLIVVRGEGFKEDLAMIRTYMRDMHPILIAVDGGADALLELGMKPHIIVGDMDSVTDKALKCGAELIVHGYTDGRAPGKARLDELGLQYKILCIPGTSEDVAMLIAYEKGATLIVAVGTHSNLVDFLDKGRKGMSSTFLVRLKVGSRFVDAKGVSKLYRSRPKPKHFIILAAAALFVIITVILISPTFQDQILMWKREIKTQIWHAWVQLKLWEK